MSYGRSIATRTSYYREFNVYIRDGRYFSDLDEYSLKDSSIEINRGLLREPLTC
ncbi:MAG: hypothetical protein ACFFBD_20550 [Candidatus Hodarchaeota archaeon]